MTRSMNQEKIGRLIAKMRKQKDLTQRQLGEMVGVGFRAVSKWERGLSMPDISIINELSEILGISSDELLNGELISKDDNQAISTSDKDSKPLKKNNKKLLLLIIPILIIITIIGMIIIRSNNQKPTEYIIKSLNPNEYLVDGTLTIEGDDLVVKINKIQFQNYNFSHTIVKNYKYDLILDNNLIFSFNSDNEYNNLNNTLSIKDFSKKFTIYYKSVYTKKINKITNMKFVINLKFYQEDNNMIERKIDTIITYNK